MSNNYLVTFFSTHHALKAEKILKKDHENIDLIPTPREISSECGFSVLIRESSAEPESLLKGIKFENIYTVKINSDGGKYYEKNN